jgi:hypothetical protein
MIFTVCSIHTVAVSTLLDHIESPSLQINIAAPGHLHFPHYLKIDATPMPEMKQVNIHDNQLILNGLDKFRDNSNSSTSPAWEEIITSKKEILAKANH